MSGLVEPTPAADARGGTTDPRTPRLAGRASPWLIPRVLGAVAIGVMWVALGVLARPIDRTCDPRLTTAICLETIDAALRKGLPAVHPLLLSAQAEPGPAAAADQYGHRATVRFGLAGVPGPVSVRLFFDAGGHWGGIPDRGAPELLAWAMGEGIVIAGAATGAWTLLRRRRAIAD